MGHRGMGVPPMKSAMGSTLFALLMGGTPMPRCYNGLALACNFHHVAVSII